MKKKNLKSLKLNKKSISHLSNEKNAIVGGTGLPTGSCVNTICAQTQTCPTDGCGSASMANCDPRPTNGCVTASCPGNGICA